MTFSLLEYEIADISWQFHIYQQRKFYTQLSRARKKVYNLVARLLMFRLFHSSDHNFVKLHVIV